MDAYITKPVKREVLHKTLEEWIPTERNSTPPLRTQEQDTSGTLDRAALTNLREIGGDEMISELAEVFADDARARLTDLKRAFDEKDAASVTQVAHTLKGSSANVGAKRMQALCSRLENTAASEDLSPSDELLEELVRDGHELLHVGHVVDDGLQAQVLLPRKMSRHLLAMFLRRDERVPVCFRKRIEKNYVVVTLMDDVLRQVARTRNHLANKTRSRPKPLMQRLHIRKVTPETSFHHSPVQALPRPESEALKIERADRAPG